MIVLLAATTAAPAEARAAILDTIGDDSRGEAACLAASEVITNALTHGRPDDPDQIELRLTALGPTLLIEVLNDPAPGFAISDVYARGGCGLGIVSALTSDWGVTTRDGRTLVWFEVT
jgi:anti-sigma regulatory factor (Ser/Thr protein kinase)